MYAEFHVMLKWGWMLFGRNNLDGWPGGDRAQAAAFGISQWSRNALKQGKYEETEERLAGGCDSGSSRAERRQQC